LDTHNITIAGLRSQDKEGEYYSEQALKSQPILSMWE
jgi:hypothetical protein